MAAETHSSRSDPGKSSAVLVAGSELMFVGNRQRPFLTTGRTAERFRHATRKC